MRGFFLVYPEEVDVYALIRPLLFSLPPEVAHAMTLGMLRAWGAVPGVGGDSSSPVTLMGLSFPNRVGLAAGFDKNATAVRGAARLGFGFVEVGTVTPRPQAGQPKPRVFRLRRNQALINRMGFPNEGADIVAGRLGQLRTDTIIGVNIGKNATTTLAHSLDDYLVCLRRVHEVADYVAVNVSSPNTPGLRGLQGAGQLEPLLAGLVAERDALDGRVGKRTPLVVKISPDETGESLQKIADTLSRVGLDGVIATNTTLSRAGLRQESHLQEAGGLSGAPLHARSVEVIRHLRQTLGAGPVVIGVGGVDSPATALAMRQAGADLVQIYTGLVYQGPGLIGRVRAVL